MLKEQIVMSGGVDDGMRGGDDGIFFGWAHGDRRLQVSQNLGLGSVRAGCLGGVGKLS